MKVNIIGFRSFSLLLGVFCFSGLQAQISMPISPQNQAVLVAGSAKFSCQVQQDSSLTDYISWDECISGSIGNCSRISNDLTKVYSTLGGDPVREDRYTVDNPSVGRYDLTITGVKLLKDAGRYRCHSRNDASLVRDARLVVLDSNPVCDHNITSNVTYKHEPYPSVYVTCSVTFSDPSKLLEPLIRFLKHDKISQTNSTLTQGVTVERLPAGGTTDTIRYSLTYQPIPGDADRIIYVHTYFDNPSVNDNIVEAANAPDFEYSEAFGPLSGAESNCVPWISWTFFICGLKLFEKLHY